MKNIFKTINEKFGNLREKNLLAKSKEVYQLQEYMGEIWLIHNGGLVCPQKMLNGNIIDVLNEIRCMYIARNKN